MTNANSVLPARRERKARPFGVERQLASRVPGGGLEKASMANRDILTIGTSAGGVEALLGLARRLPADLPASVLVTIHLSRGFRSSFDELMSRAGPLPANFALDGEPLNKGHIYLAPPDRHLIIADHRVFLGYGPRENNSRPAIDPMMRSAACCCGSRSIGVVLTGTLGDGASGLWAIGRCGGLTVVQDPSGAAFAEMPQAALQQVRPDHVVGLPDMPGLLDQLVRQPEGEPMPVPDNLRTEVRIARGLDVEVDLDRFGRRSTLSCPDCHGVMWEIDEGDLTRFRCHVGHAYTAELMSLALDESLRRALASAQRALEDRLSLARKLHAQAVAGGHRLLAETWADKAGEFEREMQVIREGIRRMETIVAKSEREEVESSSAG
jgi:two-component system chemotaxis response regulator CheB